MKATLVLLPLLGITYMLFFVNPGEDEISQIVFIYFNSFLESFQVRERLLRSVCAAFGEDDGTNVHGVLSCSPGFKMGSIDVSLFFFYLHIAPLPLSSSRTGLLCLSVLLLPKQ